ncbi:MAG: hypothetical protein EOL87_18765, partial [Spartobacteria bacterium]|nr:hypothetical protein [Spartobacteria bacterium]
MNNRVVAIQLNTAGSSSATVPLPPEITTTSLPQGTEMVAYSAQLQATNGTPPYTWSAPTNDYVLVRGESNTFNSVGGESIAMMGYYGYTNLPFGFCIGGVMASNVEVDSYGSVTIRSADQQHTLTVCAGYQYDSSLWIKMITYSNEVTISWKKASSETTCTICQSGDIVVKYGTNVTGYTQLSEYTSSGWTTIVPATYGYRNDVTFKKVTPQPAGLSVSSSGELHGTPVSAQDATFTVMVQDHTAKTDMKDLQFLINSNSNRPPVINSYTPDKSAVSMYTGDSQTFSVVASDDTSTNLTYRWDINGTVSTDASYTYTPTMEGSGTLDCYVSDDLWSNVVHQSWDITVVAPLTITTTNLPVGTELESYAASLSAINYGWSYSWSAATNEYVKTQEKICTFEEVGTFTGWADGNGAWTLDLPFEFSFYGQCYTQLFVNGNGCLSFDEKIPSCYQYENSKCIANCMYYKYYFATNDGIYVESSSNALTVRWKGNTSWNNQSGYDFNTSITLLPEGKIVNKYGAGNDNYCGYVGVSDGSGTNYTSRQDKPSVSGLIETVNMKKDTIDTRWVTTPT